MKTCSVCTLDKPLDEFHKRSSSKDGHQGICKMCNCLQRKAYYKTAHGKDRNLTTGKRLVARNRKFVYDYLLAHPCVDCGEPDPIVLEFDHQGEKDANVSAMVHSGRSLDVITKEITKCLVRCANCHKRRTAIQFEWYKDFRSASGL